MKPSTQSLLIVRQKTQHIGTKKPRVVLKCIVVDNSWLVFDLNNPTQSTAMSEAVVKNRHFSLATTEID